MKNKMKTVMTVLLAATMAFVFTSCGNKQEKALKQQIDLMNDYADEFAKDPKSDKLAKIDADLRDLTERMKSMTQLSESEARELMGEYSNELSEASSRYLQARMGSAIGDAGKMLEGLKTDGFDLNLEGILK